MNLLGHYICAVPASPEERAGAVLPDLLALHRRKVRPLALARDWSADAERVPGMTPLLAGIAGHHTVDVHFHRAPLFERGSGAIQAALLAASRTPGLKRFLPAHVLFELYLDHLLLHGRDGVSAGFYQDVADARPLMTSFAARHPLADRDAFDGFLQHVVDGRFVDAYTTHEGMFGRMDRILARLGQRTLERAERQAVAAYFRGAADETWQELVSFIAEMHALAAQTGPNAQEASAA